MTGNRPRQPPNPFQGPDNLNLTPLPELILLSQSAAPAGAPTELQRPHRRPAAAGKAAASKRKKPTPFTGLLQETAAAIIAEFTPGSSHASLPGLCCARWKLAVARAGRVDGHAPENAKRLLELVKRGLANRPPVVVDPTSDEANPRPNPAPAQNSCAAFRLPDHQLIAGQLCNEDRWEDLKIVIWGTTERAFKSTCVEHSVNLRGWLKVSSVEGLHPRVEVLCATHSIRKQAIEALRALGLQAAAGRRWLTRSAGRSLSQPSNREALSPPSPSASAPGRTPRPSNYFAPLARLGAEEGQAAPPRAWKPRRGSV